MMLGSLFGIMLGGWIFISQYSHLLIMLVSLEMMALGLFWMMSGWLGLYVGEEFFMLVFLSLAACEGAMGLAILVCLVRSHGSDNFDSMSVLSC